VKASIVGMLAIALWGVSPAEGQEPVRSQRVAQGMSSRYDPPSCKIKANHFKVSSGATYLKTGVEADVEANRNRALASGVRVLIDAMQQNGQAQNPAAWYYLGRIYLQQGDLLGADSALGRAEESLPECGKDITAYRLRAWALLMQAGNKFEEDKQLDSALASYREAESIYHASPVTYYQIAALLNDRSESDSAASYFGRAAQTAINATDTTDVAYRNRSAFNQGALLLNAKRFSEAVIAFERYLGWVPNDNEAKRGLAAAYRETGDIPKAQALEKELVSSGAMPGGGGTGSPDYMVLGVNFYNDKKYADAAAAFEKATAADPYSRDAWSNLCNAYLALKDGPKLVAAATRLVMIEPMSESALKLLGEGYKRVGKLDQAIQTAEKVLALPADLKVTEFTPSQSGASLNAAATGRAAQNATGKTIPPAPSAMVFEFLDRQGQVVASQPTQVPALEAGALHEISLKAEGPGISAWRYHRQ